MKFKYLLPLGLVLLGLCVYVVHVASYNSGYRDGGADYAAAMPIETARARAESMAVKGCEITAFQLNRQLFNCEHELAAGKACLEIMQEVFPE